MSNNKIKRYNSIFNNTEAIKSVDRIKKQEKISIDRITIYRSGLALSNSINKIILNIPNWSKSVYGKALIDNLSEFLILIESAYNIKDNNFKLEYMNNSKRCLLEIITRIKMIYNSNLISDGMFTEFANGYSNIHKQLDKWINSTKNKLTNLIEAEDLPFEKSNNTNNINKN